MNNEAIKILNALQGLHVLECRILQWFPCSPEEKAGINHLLTEGLVMLGPSTCELSLTQKGLHTTVPFLLELP